MSHQMPPEAIVFLNPPYKHIIQRKLRCSPVRSGYVFPPLELLSLASCLTKISDIELVFIDAIAEKLTTIEIIKKLKKYRVRVMVFMPGFESLEEDLKTVSGIRGYLNDGCHVVSFGYLPTLYYRDIFRKFPLIDYIMLGEPEITFKELCDGIFIDDTEINKIKGLAINDFGESIVNEKMGNEINLDMLPFPDRRLLNNNCYADPFLKKPMTGVVTSRGCPYNCIFCANFYGSFRQRSAKNVICELKHIVRDFNIRNVRFMDDNFTIDKDRLISICSGIIGNKLKLNWTCLSRVDTVDKEMLFYMSEAGCKAMFIGIESGSQKILDYYKKGYSINLIREQCRLMKEAGIEIVSWFMIGAPMETAEDVKESLKLSLEIDSDFICINELEPLPTTGVFPELTNNVFISLFPFKINYTPFNLSPKEVACLRIKFYLMFYFAPKIIWKMLLRFIKKPKTLTFFISEFISAIRLK